MWHQSVWSSAISAKIGTKFLKPGGLLQFTGAAAVIWNSHSSDHPILALGSPWNARDGRIWNGQRFLYLFLTIHSLFSNPASVHQLVRSLGDWKAAGLPENTVAFALLPVTLDTPMNRKWMPNADYST
jgi:dihydropteridine reductase